MENLFKAVRSKDINKIKDLLQVDRITMDSSYSDQLVGSIKSVKMLRSLLHKCGEEVNDYFKKHQKYILNSAIRMGKDLKILRAIINLDKSCINLSVDEGITPLIVAVSCKREISFARYLLENDADVNCCDSSNNSPIHFAEKLNKVKLLLEHGADVNWADNNGFTPIMTALCNRRHKKVILEFVESGADLDIRNRVGQTCLHLALFYRYDMEVVNELCSKTLDRNVEDISGLTPLFYALKPNMQLLHQHMYNVSGSVNNPSWDVPSSFTYPTDFIKGLIDKGFYVNTYVFMMALRECDDVDFLISLGKHIDFKCVDDKGNCALHFARDARLISWLVRRGVPINHMNRSGRTPLVNALFQIRKIEVIESLLYWGSDISKLDRFFSFGSLIDDSHFNSLVLYGLSVSLKRNVIKEFLITALQRIADYGMVGYADKISLLRHIFLSNESVTIPEDLMIRPDVNDLIKGFKTKINVLKRKIITGNTSYYDFCLKGYKSMRSNFVDEGFTDSDAKKIKKLFPTFYKEIIVKIKINIKIYIRKVLMRKLIKVNLSKPREQDKNSVTDVNPFSGYVNLVSDSLYNLGSFMNDRDINCLIAASIID